MKKSNSLKKQGLKDERKPLEKLSPKKIGKTIGIVEMLETYVLPPLTELRRRSSTTTSLAREAKRFASWQSKTSQKTAIAKIDRKILVDYRITLAEDGASVQLRNNSVRAVMQILNSAYKHGFIKHAPKLESIPVSNVAPKVYPSDAEINAIFESCKIATWPRKDQSKQPLPYPASTGWRVAFAMYRTFGFRTQELIQLEQGFRPLKWENVTAPGLTPNPVGRCEWPQGFLKYVPQKQERCKSEPLVIPIPECIRAALNLISQGPMLPGSPIFNWPLSAITFHKQLDAILTHAGVKPRPESGVNRYTLKHFRKTASSMIDFHRPGMAEHIVGHADDRSGQSQVSKRHYINSEMAVLECIQTMELPSSFNWFIDGASQNEH